MRFNFYIYLFVLVTPVISSSANASSRPSDTVVHDVLQFDVAGVKLGMTPSEARDALIAGGYRVSDHRMWHSWSAEVAAEAGKYANIPADTSQSVRFTDAEAPDFQRVSISYEVRPEGSFVSLVEYSRPQNRGSLLGPAQTKYGIPTIQSFSILRYCIVRQGCPRSIFSQASGPSLEVYSAGVGGRSMIRLSQGESADAIRQSEFIAAVRQMAPNYRDAAF